MHTLKWFYLGGGHEHHTALKMGFTPHTGQCADMAKNFVLFISYSQRMSG
jgi:hypothetical protein